MDERYLAFYARMSTRVDELRALYTELYHSQEAFAAFCEMLRVSLDRRKESLRQMDHDREENPSWYRDRQMLGYVVYTQCFAHDLRGVKERLPYLQENGVTYLHLMPLLESPAGRSDGGYAVADFGRVQPNLGTMDDLEKLADACHEQGISVCLDFVMNHTSEDHAWAKAARAGDPEMQSRYFFYDDWRIPDQYERTVPQVFPQTAPGNFTWCEEAGKVVMTTFYPYQWDLNYGNPDVLREMTAAMLELCNRGVDVIRLDAVPYIWKQLGTNCRNLPQVHTLVRILRLACEIVCPGTLLLGEVVMEPRMVAPYFGSTSRPECHMLYNVTTMATTWHTVATHDVRLLKHQLDTVFSMPQAFTFLNYLRCHDDIGWGLDYGFLAQYGMEEAEHKRFLNEYFRGWRDGSLSRGELYNDDPRLKDARLCGTTASLCGIEGALKSGSDGLIRRSLALDVMLHAFLLTQSGMPVIYSGDEIAQQNDYSYHMDPLKQDDSRYLHRGDFNWDEAEKRHDPNSVPGRLWHALQEMEKLRRAHSAFSADAECWTIDAWNEHVLCIGRYCDGEKLLALFNFSPDNQIAWINEHEDYTDLMTGIRCKARGMELPGYGFSWLLCGFRGA